MHGITLRCGARTRAFACTGRRMHTMLDMVGGLAAVHQGAQTSDAPLCLTCGESSLVIGV